MTSAETPTSRRRRAYSSTKAKAGRRVGLVPGGTPAYKDDLRVGGLNLKTARSLGGPTLAGAQQGAGHHTDPGHGHLLPRGVTTGRPGRSPPGGPGRLRAPLVRRCRHARAGGADVA